MRKEGLENCYFSNVDKRPEAPTYHIKEDLAARISQHPSVPTCYRVWLAYSTPCPGSPSSRGWAALSYIINQAGHPPLLYLWPCGCCTWLLSPLPHLLMVLTTLDFPSCGCLWLGSPFYRKFSSSYLGAVMSFPFSFFH